MSTTTCLRAASAISCLFAFISGTWAQPAFTNINAGLTGVYPAGVAWGDYDNDGRLDILISGDAGFFSGGWRTEVWRNTGSGFVNINAGFSAVGGSVAWGDYDNDGRLDILLVGRNSNSQVFGQIWRNTGSGFVDINAGLAGVEGSCAWGDFDNDGRLDVLLAGRNSGFGASTEIWRNTVTGFGYAGGVRPLYQQSAVAVGDYDNDGRLDILLAGYGVGAFAEVWRNTGGGFVNINAGLPGVGQGSVAWGDYDNDGRLDILLTGLAGNTPIAQVWRNTGSGFTNINAGLPGVYRGSCAWGDYDNDGRLDILLSGTGPGGSRITQVWRNTASGFVNIDAGLTGVDSSSVAWGDYDNDGRLDILLAGLDTTGNPTTQVWRNQTASANSPPSVPSGLSVVVTGSTLVFSWNAASDAQTPVSGLTYNLRIGTTPGGSDIVGPMSGDTGTRRVPRMGNANLKLGANLAANYLNSYYWSVQAVDGAFAGSPFAPEQSFKLLPVPVPITASRVTAGDLNGDGVVSRNELDAVLSNYFPTSPWLYMTNTAGLGGTQVTFSLSNSTAGAFSVEYTTNLANWLLLGPAIPRYEFNDTNAPAEPRRYYRLRWP